MRFEGRVPVKEVLVLRTAHPVSEEQLDKLKAKVGAELVLVLKPGEQLESLDADQMLAHGWVKAQGS